eukprot:m.398176 g.398176  ORF g.398176 m.398176 type:complete len:1112 (+) comp28369_c0_seq2:30-3365(+)
MAVAMTMQQHRQTLLHRLVIAIVLMGVGGGVSAQSTSPTAVTVTASPNVAQDCAAVESCKADVSCNECYTALEPFLPPPEDTPAFINHLEKGFYLAARRTPACNTTGTALMLAAFAGLQPCPTQPRHFALCQVRQYLCLTSGTCTECLHNVYTMPSTRGAYESAACRRTPHEDLALLNSNCYSLPQCTWSKMQCGGSACSACWDALQRNDPATAVRLCSNRTLQVQLDHLVANCMRGSMLACAYFEERCTQTPSCNVCYEAIDHGVTVMSVAQGLASEGCLATRGNASRLELLAGPFDQCPITVYSDCVAAVFICAAISLKCAQCIAGVATNTTECNAILDLYDVPSTCIPCPPMISSINEIVLATSVVGAISAVACVVTVLVLVAHSRDKRSMRDRVVVGLMVSNSVYSLANIVPVNQLQTGVHCGELALPFDAIRSARAVWFCGKYALVSFELFILGASMWALASGLRALPRRVEAALHLGCYLGGVAALVGFYVPCAEINSDGYNRATQAEAQSGRVVHADPADDVDDDYAGIAAGKRFESSREQYDTLVQRMLQAWIALLLGAVLAWMLLRRAYAQLLARSRAVLRTAAKGEASDDWALTRRSEWRSSRELVQMQKQAFADVARPLEPYLAVFVVFGVPAIVMATDFCQTRSTATTGGASADTNTPNIVYGTCDIWCEFILAFRSLATVAVYYRSRERRAELVDVRTTLRLLSRRFGSCCSPSNAPVELSPLATAPLVAGGARVAETDFELDTRLAEGTFGVVWSAKWRDGGMVAVKILKAGAVDSEGDAIDAFAEEDFRKECEVLQRLNHPHLLKFLGYGSSMGSGSGASMGKGFIVTELMPLGSLRSVLRDESRDLSREVRLTIARQLAEGMAHLHSIPIVHRDFKSANVLLGNDMCAKVADFGTGRMFRTRQPRVIVSSFTGVVRSTSVPDTAVDLIDDAKGATAAAPLGLVDAHGTMTKAVGTLLWQAPEMFRGDRNYGSAVDVYSYGIVCWELCTRQTPWDELGRDVPYIELLNRLMHALQTGRRPALPPLLAHEHPEITQVMRSCWAGDPGDRPRFADVAKTLAVHQPPPASGAARPMSVSTRSLVRRDVDSLAEPLLAES